MRIFIAVFATQEIQEGAVLWQEKLRDLPVKWVPRQNIHLTLLPPWNSKEISGIAKDLEKLKGAVGPFSMKFEVLKYGPNIREPRMIWAEGPASEELMRLKEIAEDALDQKSPMRFFRPHLTLARFNPFAFRSFPIKSLNEEINWKLNINKISLVESFLEPEGARYDILSEIVL